MPPGPPASRTMIFPEAHLAPTHSFQNAPSRTTPQRFPRVSSGGQAPAICTSPLEHKRQVVCELCQGGDSTQSWGPFSCPPHSNSMCGSTCQMTGSGRVWRDEPKPLTGSAKPGNANHVQERRKHGTSLACSALDPGIGADRHKHCHLF